MNDVRPVALVTGGSQGLGRSVCLSLAERGMNVAVNYSTSEAAANDVVSDLTKLGVQAVAIRADVADEDAVAEMVDAVAQRWGRLDVLVNNAAYTSYAAPGDFAALTPQMWQRTLDVNVLGPWHCVKHMARVLADDRPAAIVNVASAAALYGTGSSIAYAASKAALIAMTKSLARALAPKVRVNAVAPGAIPTNWLVNNGGGDEQAAAAQLDRFAGRTLLQRAPSITEVTSAITWLALDGGGVTGETITIDCGFGLPK